MADDGKKEKGKKSKKKKSKPAKSTNIDKKGYQPNNSPGERPPSGAGSGVPAKESKRKKSKGKNSSEE